MRHPTNFQLGAAILLAGFMLSATVERVIVLGPAVALPILGDTILSLALLLAATMFAFLLGEAISCVVCRGSF